MPLSFAHLLDAPHRPSLASTSLEVLLLLNPDIAFATWTSPAGRAVIDLLRIPEQHRRQGLGTMIYRAWERRLANGTTVELFAVDAGARAFWSSLGFEDMGDGGMEKTVRRFLPAHVEQVHQGDLTDHSHRKTRLTPAVFSPTQ